uniref:Uncharacterized protein n=1 Tax=Parascaris univalens TaxID=6257 RepID=A0A915ASP7_PARUN
IWLNGDMVDNETASTSSTFEQSNSTVALHYDRIVELFNNSSMIRSNVTTDDDLVKALNIWNVFEELPWLIWAIVTIGVIGVIGVVAAITTCIIWNKKRVIRRGSASDIRIVGAYDSFSKFSWPEWMICCPKLVIERREQLKAMRQNSASNLDPYKRPPLPPINADKQHLSADGYQGSYLPPHRLAPISLQAGDTAATVRQMQANGLHRTQNNIRQDELFGIQIAGIRGVPMIEVSDDQRRELPTPSTVIESAWT